MYFKLQLSHSSPFHVSQYPKKIRMNLCTNRLTGCWSSFRCSNWISLDIWFSWMSTFVDISISRSLSLLDLSNSIPEVWFRMWSTCQQNTLPTDSFTQYDRGPVIADRVPNIFQRENPLPRLHLPLQISLFGMAVLEKSGLMRSQYSTK